MKTILNTEFILNLLLVANQVFRRFFSHTYKRKEQHFRIKFYLLFYLLSLFLCLSPPLSHLVVICVYINIVYFIDRRQGDIHSLEIDWKWMKCLAIITTDDNIGLLNKTSFSKQSIRFVALDNNHIALSQRILSAARYVRCTICQASQINE